MAMPRLASESVSNPDAVVFVCKHDKEGSVGFVINQPVKDFSLQKIDGTLDTRTDRDEMVHKRRSILWGGNTDSGDFWILHSMDQSWGHTVRINSHCGVTANLGTIDDVLSGAKVPAQFMFCLGRVEWKPGILNREIQDGLWMTSGFDANVLFASACQWDMLAGRMGVNRLTLAPVQGLA